MKKEQKAKVKDFLSCLKKVPITFYDVEYYKGGSEGWGLYTRHTDIILANQLAQECKEIYKRFTRVVEVRRKVVIEV